MTSPSENNNTNVVKFRPEMMRFGEKYSRQNHTRHTRIPYTFCKDYYLSGGSTIQCERS